jgi:putative two-component system response regulator
MNNSKFILSDILSDRNNNSMEELLKLYSLENFANEVDYKYHSELLKKLISEQTIVLNDLKELNKMLVQKEEMLAEAQQIALLGRWDYYSELNEVVWSKSLYDILEIDPSINASLDLFFTRVHPEDDELFSTLYKKMFEMHDSWTAKYRLMMPDGRVKWVHLSFNPTTIDQRNTMHYYGTLQDVTEMNNAEEKLEKYAKHLEELVDEKVQEISDSQMAMIYALIKLAESRDDDTGAHIERTSSFCRLLALKARNITAYASELTDDYILTIQNASPLHDIGKVGIPDSILLKPGKLTTEEFEIMKTHSMIGYQTLAKVASKFNKNMFISMGMDIALYHHEKWNGSGYPMGLSGGEIPLSARIMTVADVYDALRSKRVYKEAFSHEKSIGILAEGQGKNFDPALINILFRNQGEFEKLYESMTYSEDKTNKL